MLKRFLNFIRTEEGAVTVDWVVITAAVVVLAGVAITSLQTATGGLGTNVGNYMSETEIN